MTLDSQVYPGLEQSIHQLTMLVVMKNELVRHGIASMLSSVATVGEVWTCAGEQEALAMVSTHRPDVILCHGTGPAALPLLRAATTHSARLLLLLEDLDLAAIDEPIMLGAHGFLLQDDATVEVLQAAMDRLVAGDMLLPSELARALMTRVAGAARATSTICLTSREREVLGLLAQGMSNKQIARRMDISEHGVKRHVTNLLAKLNAPNRTLAVAVALQDGLITQKD
jgi:two-component system nitrate/nitrite response regulator NarL